MPAASDVKRRLRKARRYRRDSPRYKNGCIFTVVFLIRRFGRGQLLDLEIISRKRREWSSPLALDPLLLCSSKMPHFYGRPDGVSLWQPANHRLRCLCEWVTVLIIVNTRYLSCAVWEEIWAPSEERRGGSFELHHGHQTSKCPLGESSFLINCLQDPTSVHPNVSHMYLIIVGKCSF